MGDINSQIDWKTVGIVCGFLGLGSGQIGTIISSNSAEEKVASVEQTVKTNLTDTAKDLRTACAAFVGPPPPAPDCVTKDDLEAALRICLGTR